MQLLDIFRESRPGRKNTTLLYHGTSSKYIDSIKKHGLLPDTGNKGFGSFEGPGSESYGGVYLTANYIIAREAALESVEIAGGRPIIIKVQYVLGSGGTDEDQITHNIIAAFNNTSDSDDFVYYLGRLDLLKKIPMQDRPILYKLYQVIKNIVTIKNNGGSSEILANPEFRKIIKKLIEKIKVYGFSSWSSVRVTRPIGFKGKTKILSINYI